MTRAIDRRGTPVQHSMTVRPEDYTSLNLTRMMLGVVLDVFPADDERNRSSYQRGDRRGYLHTCSVLVIEDGRGTHLPLENVIIPPEAPSGLDDYSEKLPRGCSQLVTGESWNSQMNHINPYDLDGDWCVVGFLGGSIDRPFIVRWWPHPHNPFDPATSGKTNPVAPTEGETLVQDGRYFQRINGVEFVVTKKGHLYLSTYRANSRLRFGSDLSPVDGRFPRELQESTGGSIKCWIKPSQSFELDWNTPVDGMGVLDVSDDEIPQSNPSESGTSSTASQPNTYVLFEKDRIDITVPDEIKLLSKKRLLLESQEETTLTVGADLTADVSGDGSVTVDGALDLAVTGQATITASNTLGVQATGAATISSQDTLSLSGATVSIAAGAESAGGPGSMQVTPTGVTIGTGSLGGAVGGDNLQLALTLFAAQVQAAQASATVETTYATALTAAANALAAAITAAISTTTRVG